MGWGEPHRAHVDIPPACWTAARNLAQRVRDWQNNRTTANEIADRSRSRRMGPGNGATLVSGCDQCPARAA
jgi:hypothetical protein